MRFARIPLGDPRLHFCGLLVLLTMILAGILGRENSTPCPACPGHTESARDCLCYHAPVPFDESRR